MLTEHRRLLRATLASTRRRRALHRGRLVLRRVRGRVRRARRLRDRPARAGRPRLARTPRPPRGSGWACTPATPSRSPASTPARRCTGPPGSPPPPTAARCSARPRPRTTPPRFPPRRTCSTSACTGCAASTTGSGCSSSSRPGLERQFPRPRTVDEAQHNLPTQVTSFVGRQTERIELGTLLTDHRLVTVVGAGGAGKTRLAVEVAADARRVVPGRGLVRRRRDGDRPGAGRVRGRRGASACGPSRAGR